MEKKVLVAVAAALVSSVGALHPESARAADAAASAFEDSTVDASLDPGEKRVSSDADIQARLADLRYAYFIGYNARAREDSKSYATLGDEVKHRQKQPAAPAMPASPKPVAERVAPPRRVVAQAAPPKHVTAPVASPKRDAAARAAPVRQVVVQAAPVPLKHGPAQVASAPPRRVSAPVVVASLKQASLRVTPPKRAETQPVPLKQVPARTTPPKLFATESEPPILIPTQAVTALPHDDEAQVTPRRDLQNAQRAAPQYRQADEEPQYAAEQGTQAAYNRQARQYQNQWPQQSRQPQQYAAAPAYNQTSTEFQESGGYARRDYAPPPRTVQANQYAPAPYPPARYQPVDAQSAYVPRPPAQAAAQQVIMVGRPPAYPAYNEMYTPPELRRPYPAGYGNPGQPAGYQGWE
ncbi:hypothetical protein DSC91_001024 [Paraburkholderia caffeinilytica]|uniref:Uncharacterized protein n=1 Tax=Paraburkholderia caffeinilytica TaxID=1761016 RepID=A0ABQ1MY60_9BURK|nr:hypothetical protein [Paraburkholderia caffeinilytica]AXL49263.1 hypothetical protein DSC91_001024 [Paraburkholderia caffeinilytica]GGC48781.1 hypothetical protein GCM10011400_40190 [Paraburkholderia caffeinilytica]CAB3782329.1 hypothetical protein LMG28690_01313 [Paraburkholderia caffeinilytica]